MNAASRSCMSGEVGDNGRFVYFDGQPTTRGRTRAR